MSNLNTLLPELRGPHKCHQPHTQLKYHLRSLQQYFKEVTFIKVRQAKCPDLPEIARGGA